MVVVLLLLVVLAVHTGSSRHIDLFAALVSTLTAHHIDQKLFYLANAMSSIGTMRSSAALFLFHFVNKRFF